MPKFIHLISGLVCISSVIALNKFVDDFETLSYNTVHAEKERVRKASGFSDNASEKPLRIRFKAHNRSFHLVLRPISPDEPPFAGDLTVDHDGEYHDVRPHHFLYEGYVDGDPASRVYGSLFDGVFDGHIHFSDGNSYTVDKTAKYYAADERPSSFHSVIYHDNQINHRTMRMDESRVKREIDEHHSHGSQSIRSLGCALDGETKDDMERVQRSAVDGDNTGSSHRYAYGDDYTFTLSNFAGRRARRSIYDRDAKNRYKVRTCSMYFQADHKLYQEILKKEGNNDPTRTREEIVSMFYTHVRAVNDIYENTNFNGVQGINFAVKRVSVYTPNECYQGKPLSQTENPFCEEHVDVSNYLNLNSQKNHSMFCLAYAMTYRDFVGGTLGLAWVASPQMGTAGGVCQVHQHYNEGARGNVYRSLNTGIVTLVNYGNRVPPRVSQLTLAHEIGHNFGSPHDFPADCQPGLPDGNFIMFASATSGDKPNNAKFSRCSVGNISAVLEVLLRQQPIDPARGLGPVGTKRNCLQERSAAFCGNNIPEAGEQCDCGFTEKDCHEAGDKCCYWPDNQHRFKPCTRKPGAACSPSEGACCNPDNCQFHVSVEGRECKAESECTHRSTCDGLAAKCPDPTPKADGLACDDATKVCKAGTCDGSVCEQVGLKDCFLTAGSPESQCFLACFKNGVCMSSRDLPEFGGNRSRLMQLDRKGQPGILLRPGSPCNNYKGYCDIFRKCRSVDANGPLARLKNMLFSPQTLQTVSSWTQQNWWAVVGGGIVLLLLMGCFIKCCAVHTPSTNPNKAPALNLYNTLTRPSTLIRQRRNRQGRSAAPTSSSVLAGPTTSTSASASRGPGERRAARSSAAPRMLHAASAANAASVTPSAPPLPSSSSRSASSSAPVLSSMMQQPGAPPVPLLAPPPGMPPPAVIVVEPPPPYTAAADPGSALGLPKRGHRNNKKRQTSADARPKSGRLFFSATLVSCVSSFSLQSLLQPISTTLNTETTQVLRAVVVGSSHFDISTCGKGKGCFLPADCIPGSPTNPCTLAFSFRPLDRTSIEMELFATLDDDVKEDSFYVAVGFSDDDMMGDETVSECSRLISEKTPSVKASYNYFHDEENNLGVDNKRIVGEENVRSSIFSSASISTTDGVIYCKFTQKIDGQSGLSMEYLTTTADTPFYFLLAKGTTTETGLKKHGRKGTATSTPMKFSDTGSSSSSFCLSIVTMITITSSAFSLRSLIQPISDALESSVVSEAVSSVSPFDISTCDKDKGCFLPNNCVPGASDDNGCILAYSYRPIDDVTVEMELYATIETELTEQSYWVAVAFSDDENMGDDPVTECSLLTSEKQPSIKASYNFYDDEKNKVAANNRRIEGEQTVRSSLFNTTTITTADGVIYCKFTQKIGGLVNMNREFLSTDCQTPFYFLLAKGITNDTDITKHHHHQRAVSEHIKFSDTTGSASSVSLFLVALITVGRMFF
uniref:ADAM10 endopeptidase n=1 Tax=Pristionchus pacificus TaxID=54126 RepID=A0A2A6CBY4_PRIPA|eukprot:PDM75735.1 sup-17 [Pristionchus pacificus]